MEIKTNTTNKLQKIMNGESFSDELTFIGECLQNCQRSNAKNVYIDIVDDKMSFVDDGCGCKNPEVVLTLDSSEWKSTNEGFGIGFMSIFAIPGLTRLVIRSRDWIINLDVNEVRRGNLEYFIDKADYIDGFSVEMYSPYFINNESEISERLYSDAQYITKFNSYYNGSRIETKSILDDYTVRQYGLKINCPEFEGILEVSRWGGIKVYYENRFVCETYNLANGVAGVIILKKGKGLLREPDRKEFVRNSHFRKLVKTMDKYSNKLYKNYVDKYGLDNEAYISGIAQNLSEKEIEERLDLESVIAESAKPKKEKKSVTILPEMDNVIEAPAEIPNTIQDMMLSVTESMNRDSFSEENSVSTNNYVAAAERQIKVVPTISPDISEKTKTPNSSIGNLNSKETLKEFNNNLKVAFWVNASDVETYKDDIAEAKYHGIPVVISKNMLYDHAFEKRCPHISEMSKYLQISFIKKNVCIKNSKEETFLTLLAPICNKYNIPINTFKIANLQRIVAFEKNGRVLYRDVTKDGILGLSSKANGIYLDRRMLRLKDFSIKKGRVSIKEYKCLMNAVETISHELAHYLYGTQDNTIDHFKTQLMLQNEIIKLY